MKDKAVVIGSGFAGLSAAISLAHKGYEVTLLEKNDMPGGRARQWVKDGFIFDLGPSWYWMPDVFEAFFSKFGKKVSDYYELYRLDPAYKVFFKDDEVEVPADLTKLKSWMERREPGSAAKLDKFLKEAAYKYEVGINDLVYRPGRSIFEFADWRVLTGLLKMDLLTNISKHIRSYFSDPYIIQLLEFPVLFLGERAWKTPALYSLMNYADLVLGTWYPKGGMYSVVKALVSLAEEKGVTILYNQEVKSFEIAHNQIKAVLTENYRYEADVVIAGADYHHVDQQLLPEKYRNYSERYWQTRKMAPSSLLFYLGVNKRIEGLPHHTLFFDRDFALHAEEIYGKPQWPTEPLFYISVTSKTEKTAPESCENLTILIPLAPGLEDSEQMREKYYHVVMDRLEKRIGQEIRPHVVVKRSYAMNDFVKDYHAFKGNAYGLANTLLQTAILKPSLKNKKLHNLYYTGQLTVPGPGVPPSLISGWVVANEVVKDMNYSTV
ncbi:phytoene dehydrogenase [Thermaurantimonas aggregans]|uniref:Phytoene dehydrogenase n=1 Tax=Thermaurantimonas aggregans TaxID=2173829 RepID=A0A401XNH2_9FLAO|nr:phytoene desaturase family protein [Thermaurantimonas aggregans]MCX8147647.1 phytoene desaturase family protein [Thermaurantimonas aggregans]GCD78550.1 phytoene dehydrogenase [Thermaurantimonas aggregans]